MVPDQYSSAPTPHYLSLADALTKLEDGGAFVGMAVELGQGRHVALDNLADAPGFQQRLRAHRMLLAVASGQVSLPLRPSSGPPEMCPRAKELLDAVTASG